MGLTDELAHPILYAICVEYTKWATGEISECSDAALHLGHAICAYLAKDDDDDTRGDAPTSVPAAPYPYRSTTHPDGSEDGSDASVATTVGRLSPADYQGVSGRVTGGTPTTDPFSPDSRVDSGWIPTWEVGRIVGEEGTSGYPPKGRGG